MGECIGLDFGTTYSVIARIKNEQVESAILAQQNNGTVDSIVAESPNGKMFFGSAARAKVVQSDDYHIYKGFKMLLSEENSEAGRNRLREYGFKTPDEPIRITELFLGDLIEKYKDRYEGTGDIERLVIGVPEVWFNTSINSRNRLQEIASRIVGDDKVQLESEPKLACAYLVYKYKRENNRYFDGNILLVDFGGGTLDIAVCEVNNREGRPEISIIYKTGVGANEQRRIGNAGLAFLEHVVNRALSEAGLNDFSVNNEYYECIHTVENELMDTIRIKEAFQDAESKPEVLSEEFCRIRYNNARNIVVTYKMLFDAYDMHDISGVFGEKLSEVRAVLDEKGIGYKDANCDNFKIALVGGFCNFYLTQKQVMDTEGFKYAGLRDHRYDMFLQDGDDREKAVAYGAALLANNTVSFAKQVPYSLFILPFRIVGGRKIPNESQQYIVFHENEELEFDKPYMVKRVMTNQQGNIVVGADGKPVSREVRFNAGRIPFIRKVVGKDKFDGQPSINLELPPRTIKIGFSLDRNYILSLHIYECDPTRRPQEIVKRLSDINDLLGGLPNTYEEV